ncbi:MAG: NADH dehydrogenase [Clostridia bacterium]|nr:NADH dehydrogenase [Clostridia bacterium]
MILLAGIIWPFLSAVIGYLIGRKNKNARDAFVLFGCALEFILCLILLHSTVVSGEVSLTFGGICGLGLSFVCDGFRAVYACIAAFMWLMSNGVMAKDYFAHHYRNRNRYYLFTLMTEGATLGVFFGASLYTSFVFFEIMSLTSYVWVAHEENSSAMRAAETYLAVAIICGMVTLMGLFRLYHQIGTLMIDEIYSACAAYEDKSQLYLSAGLIAVGFAAKAGVFPLHIWLPKAHPVAPAPASALLSGMLTKSGIFGLIAVCFNIFPGDIVPGLIVFALGIVTMFIGALLALFSIDLKRTLACSSMSQIGFILVGMGMGVALGHHGTIAVHGMLLHMVNHSLIKLVLFMVAGAVYMNLHKLDLNEIRGFGRKKPILHFSYLMGYLGIIGMPFWNGFISKSLLHESILEYISLLMENGSPIVVFKISEWIFLLTGGMTAAYMTKLYVALFWEKNDPTTQKRYDEMPALPWRTKTALIISSALLPVLGMAGNIIMQKTAVFMQSIAHASPLHETMNYFTAENFKGAVISLAIGAAIYLLVVRRLLMKKENGKRVYINRWPVWLDLESLVYRPLIEQYLPEVLSLVARIMDGFFDVLKRVGGLLGTRVAQLMDAFIQPRAIGRALTVFARLMDDCVDTIALKLWNTLFHRARKRRQIPIGNRLTYTAGHVMDSLVALLNRTVRRNKPISTNFTYLFAAGWDEMNITYKRVTLSVSFGLLLLVIGLCFAFIYVLSY